MKRLTLIVALLVGALHPADADAQDETSTDTDAAAEDGATDASDERKEDAEKFVTVPDRPTFSAAASAVPAGHAQLEVGGEFSTTDGASQLAFPVLARIGIAQSFELRAGLPSFIVPLSDESGSTLGSLQLGAKVADAVTDQLSLGALPYLDIATGVADGETSFSQSTFGALMLWGFGLTDAVGIGGNLGVSVGPSSTDEAGPRELFYAASLTASVGLGDLGVTAEGFTVLGQYADATVGASLSAGYAVFDKLVVDVYAGSSAQSDATNIFAGAGVTIAR